jgi:transposase
MNREYFIGIDVCKLKIDVFIHRKNLYRQFNNEQTGFEAMVKWVLKAVGQPDFSRAMICFENTGIYSLPLAIYLEAQAIAFCMTSALEIKRSTGIARGKNDKIDARRIAEYAFRHQDKLRRTVLPPKAIMKLHPLLTLRDRLVRSRAGYEVSIREQRKFLPGEDFPELYQAYTRMIATLKEEIKKLEKAIGALIQGDEQLKQTFERITGIPGVGLIVASYTMVYTHNFTRFNNWRKFACYAGIAPFDFQSGSSVKARPKVNGIANRQMKKILHVATMHAARYDREMGAYYKRRIEAGYNKMSTLNALRNKLLARIFAVAGRKDGYVKLMKFVA